MDIITLALAKKYANSVRNKIIEQIQQDYYDKDEVNRLVDTIPKFSIKVVTELPTEDISSTTIYLYKNPLEQDKNLYTEYIYIDGQWEVLGSQKINFDEFASVDALNAEITRAMEVEDDLRENIHALQANEPIIIANLDGLLTPADLDAFEPGLYYFINPVFNVCGENSISGLTSIGNDYINNLDHGYYFSDFNGINYTTCGSIDGFGITEAGSVIGEIEQEIQELDEKIKQAQLYKFPNAVIQGNPTINHGQISDFSKEDHLQLPFLVDVETRPFTFELHFTTANDLAIQQNILSSKYGLEFFIKNNHFYLAVSSNGTSWNVEPVAGSLEVTPNTSYYVKINWNKLQYKVDYSLDGNIYRNDITTTWAFGPKPKVMYIGISNPDTQTGNYFRGSINLNYWNLYIGDELVWQGMDDVGLASRLATDIHNIDAEGISRIKEIVAENFVKISWGAENQGSLLGIDENGNVSLIPGNTRDIRVNETAIITTTGGDEDINPAEAGFAAKLERVRGNSIIQGQFKYPEIIRNYSDEESTFNINIYQPNKFLMAVKNGDVQIGEVDLPAMLNYGQYGLSFNGEATGIETFNIVAPVYQTIDFPTINSFNSTQYNLLNNNIAKVIKGLRYQIFTNNPVYINGRSQAIEANYISNSGNIIPYSFIASETGDATYNGSVLALVWSGEYYNRSTNIGYSLSTIPINKTLRKIDVYYDELDLINQVLKKRIYELPLTEENLEKTKHSIRVITENIIWYVDDISEEPIAINSEFQANDFGQIYFLMDKAIPVEFSCNYGGVSLVDTILSINDKFERQKQEMKQLQELANTITVKVNDHIADDISHITDEEREKWNKGLHEYTVDEEADMLIIT